MPVERQKKNIAATVRELVQPVADEMGYLLWDVEYVKEGAEMVLRITIDSDAGIGIEDCERFHRTVDPMLDEADPIEGSYRLETTSPGVERTLTRPEHFARCMGEKVEVRLYAPLRLEELRSSPLDGQKQFVGVLSAADGDTLTLTVGEETVTLPMDKCAKVQTIFEW